MHIWVGNKVQYIKGNASQCCEQIIKYIAEKQEDGKLTQRYFDVMLDKNGIGIYYADYFKTNGIEFIPIVPARIL